ncbi:MAG TPA: phenylalanine--tRNA ligase subunit alpha [Methanothermococcus okinawensis]|uniref:Phenylalanine--tRNA ligase alpha subunit n=1 Tax=Methanothermococcus okinawensis TaxID=155863 RepID=A0A832ZCE5_9EURY|nr:phenylalanine--tRNA ligase subunit alpha [Methanothermococcus okinawensis]HIP90982.1 phenylalanine--tRNA ligase subunit alpha [Methanothermococcus okinawensis]
MELHTEEKKLLKIFQDTGREEITVEELSRNELMKSETKVMRSALWLSGKGLVDIVEKKRKYAKLSERGEKVLREGLPERKIVNYLKERGMKSIPIKEIGTILDKSEITPALGHLKRKGIAKIEKGILHFKNLDYRDEEEEILRSIKVEGDMEKYPSNTLEILKKRGFIEIEEVTERSVKLTEKGKEYIKKPIEIKEEISQLTREDIITNRWKECYIRPYDVDVPTEEVYPAKYHPLTRVISQVREILIGMGFKEVKSPIVETEFWNFDVLFEPQDHPARDMQDTFFLKYPRIGEIPEELLRKVKEIHERGSVEGRKISKGWNYKFQEEISRRTILRTHTTVSSIRYLASLSQEEREKPHKVFCIDRVFRNEAIDYKHLPEFYQCDGIVMDKDVNFNNLIGILVEFLKRLGFEKVRVRPAYFPFTEPSLEAEVYLEGKGWLEILGAGIFRPEVLEPLGIDKPVLAWGIGLSRLAMLKLGLKDIRELHRNDLKWLKRIRYTP